MQIDPASWPAVSRLMDTMLELPEAERAGWVRALSGDDAAFQPQLLEMLQGATLAGTSGWLETLPKMGDAALYTLMESGTSAEQAGDEIGPYRLVRILGTGGMGSVWYAERSDGMMRRGVALKLPHGSSRQLAARFEREREIVASLVHPNIARLYDAGVSAKGQAYLALEYAEGQALDKYADLRRFDLPARLALFAQVLSAVQYAHSRLVIHRDIKPSNILVTNAGEVRLLDFGVAKLLDTETPEPSDLTRLSDAGMTLAYASPEQVAGRPVTTATDIYSLGVVLFELLAGARPYRVKRDTRGALEEAILQGEVPLASIIAGTGDAQATAHARTTTVKKLHAGLRGDLDAILLKALSRQPQDRYETAASFADDIERHRSGRPVRAHRRSRWYQMRKFVGRNRLAVGATLATVAALTTTTGIALWQAREAQRQARIAAVERDRALAAAEHREAVDEFMSDLLLEAGRTGKPISVSDLISRANDLSIRQFADNPEARAAVLRTVGTFALEFDGIERALTHFDQARQLLAQSPDHGLTASVSCNWALLRGALGGLDEAERTFARETNDPDTPGYARSECWEDMAQLAIARNDAAKGVMASERALAEWEASAQHSPTRHLELLTIAARAQGLDGKPGKADAGFAQVMAELSRLGRERGPLGFSVRDFRINAAMESGDPRLALAQIDASIAIIASDVPDKPPPVLTRYERCKVLADLGQYEDALDGLRNILSRADVDDRLIAKRALVDSAVILARLGRMDEAERSYRLSVGADGREPSTQGLLGVGEVAQRLARATLDLQAHDFAAVRHNLAQATQMAGVSPISLAAMLRVKSAGDLGEAKFDEAVDDARRGLEISQRLRGDKPFSLFVGQAQLALGKALEARGDTAGARKAYTAAIEQLSHAVDPQQLDLIAARDLLRRLLADAARPLEAG